MEAVRLVRGWNLLPFTSFLTGIGAPVDRWLGASKISPDFLQNPDHWIPFRFAVDFVERAARAEGAETLGLDVGRRTAAESLGPWGLNLGRCPTLYDRALTASRLIPRLNNAAKIWLAPDGERVRLCQRFRIEPGYDMRHCEDFSLMLILEAVGRAAEPGWHSLEIHLPERRSLRFVRDELFQGVRIVYGSRQIELVFSKDLLARALAPLPRQAISTCEAPRAGEAPSLPLDFVRSLECAVGSVLPLHCPSVEEIAGLADLSPRTLQRRLAEAGTSVREVIDHARFRLADEYLRDPATSVTDTAFLLGYSDSTAFTRAFHRMTGLSPSEYRTRICDA